MLVKENFPEDDFDKWPKIFQSTKFQVSKSEESWVDKVRFEGQHAYNGRKWRESRVRCWPRAAFRKLGLTKECLLAQIIEVSPN